MIEKIKRMLNDCSDPEHIYLLEKIDEKSGFFALENKVIFMRVCDDKGGSNSTVKTEKLSLVTNIEIVSLSNTSSFGPGTYDYILFGGNVEENDFESFIRICLLFSKEGDKVSVKDFFYSILAMFQLPAEQSYKNLIGLMGELWVLKNIYEATGISVASGWHENTTDKYDINYKNLLIEVKTTTSDLYTVKIKHDQLFGQQGVILSAVRVKESNAGISLKELVNDINSIEIFANNFRFQVELGKELKRVSPDLVGNKLVELKGMRYYSNEDIETIEFIPDSITQIEYNCTLIETPEIDIADLIRDKN